MPRHSTDGSTWSMKLLRIGELSARDKNLEFNSLGHFTSTDWLRELYRRLDGANAIGIGGLTKESFGTKLEGNLTDLLKRIRRGQYAPKAARIVGKPNEDGSTRPLDISCFEESLNRSC